MEDLFSILISRVNYWAYILLMMIGLWGVIFKCNLMKKIISMGILQTAIILFFISIGAKKNATIPILVHAHDHGHVSLDAAQYINPLPHVLMLTAIVVAVATLGVALALCIKIYNRHATLEEDDIIPQLWGKGEKRQ